MKEARKRLWRGSLELKQRAKDLRKEKTSTEDILWSALRNKQLGGLKFRRQHPIHRAIADFCCAELKLIVEVDGSIHEIEEQHNHDLVRDEWLRERGYTVVRFKNQEVENSLNDVLAQILATTQFLSRFTGEDRPPPAAR